MKVVKIPVLLFLILAMTVEAAEISGELFEWHKITLTFKGPQTSETATPNPFTDYRLNVTFTHDDVSCIVPGYFAADGDAANTSATEGDIWRVHFCPDAVGIWEYSVSFRQGENAAVSDDPNVGTPYSALDGQTGSFDVGPSDKVKPDLRAKGRLRYVGERYLRFAETCDYFLKQGADAPENFLAYEDFDNTPNNGNRRKSWAPHAEDWREGDPTWKDGKGSEIIGAINYLASEGMNVFSFLTMNINGDDKNVFPYISDKAADRTRMDCSKLDQWEIVFNHGQKMGMYLHFKTQETENEMLLDNGDVGTERRLYYRELIARFGHHLALNWNLGEENGALGNINQSTAQRRAMAQYFYDHDPYHHHIVIHNGREPEDLLGDKSKLTGYSLQTSQTDFSRVHGEVVEWINKSVAAGKPWVVACDEPGDASHALVPDKDDPTHDDARRNGLWGCLIGGGGGNEWYFGYQHDHSDLTCQDFRSRDLWWDQCRIALNYFRDRTIPFWNMESNDGLVSGVKSWCLAEEGGPVLVYAPEGGKVTLNLSDWPENMHTVEWFDPRTGQSSVGRAVTGGAKAELAPPPPFDSEFVAYLFIAEDNTPPIAPTDLGLEALGEREIKVTWKEASDEDSGIGAYLIYRDGEPAGTISPEVFVFTDTHVRPSTTYEYKVTAINGSGVEGPAVGPETVSTWEDTSDPELIDIHVQTSRSIQLVFSEELDKESAETTDNYTITNNIEIRRARISDDLLTVRLITSAHEEDVTYTVIVANIRDLAGRIISADANSLTYQLSSDQIWFFAEDAERANGGALKPVEGTLGLKAACCPGATSSLTFTVDIDNEGEWFVWGRFMFIGSDNDPNSFFLSADDGTQQKFGNNKDFFNQWHWDGDGDVENGATTPLSLGTLSAGEHTITLTCREPLGNPGSENILIDMLYLTMLADDKPSDERAPKRTAVNQPTDSVPTSYTLENYPNPFNPQTHIHFFLPTISLVSIDVFDVLGQKIRTCADHKNLDAGFHTLVFDGSELSSGIYLCRLQTESIIIFDKMMLVK